MNLKHGRIVPSFAVSCGKCRRAHEEAIGARTRAEASRDLKRAGWALTRAWGYICPECDGDLNFAVQSLEPQQESNTGAQGGQE
jgi:hypothetical protein